MEEEFKEADVLWPDAALASAHHHDCLHRRQHLAVHQQQQPRAAATASAAVVRHPLQSSPPVRIIPPMPPVGSRSYPWTRSSCDDGDGAEEVGVDLVPPHVVLAARRCAEERRERVAASVCVGHGRTLKGRDLRAVRNAVLHMTGFLSSSDDKY